MTVKTPITVGYGDDIILCAIMDETTSLSQISIEGRRTGTNSMLGKRETYPEEQLKAGARRVTGEYKQRIVEESEQCRYRELGLLLYQEGLTYVRIRKWRIATAEGTLKKLSLIIHQKFSFGHQTLVSFLGVTLDWRRARFFEGSLR